MLCSPEIGLVVQLEHYVKSNITLWSKSHFENTAYVRDRLYGRILMENVTLILKKQDERVVGHVGGKKTDHSRGKHFPLNESKTCATNHPSLMPRLFIPHGLSNFYPAAETCFLKDKRIPKRP